MTRRQTVKPFAGLRLIQIVPVTEGTNRADPGVTIDDPPTPVPANATGMEVRVERGKGQDAWPEKPHITIRIGADVSFDDGKTWIRRHMMGGDMGGEYGGDDDHIQSHMIFPPGRPIPTHMCTRLEIEPPDSLTVGPITAVFYGI